MPTDRKNSGLGNSPGCDPSAGPTIDQKQSSRTKGQSPLANVVVEAVKAGRSVTRLDEVIVEAPLLIRLGHTSFVEGKAQLTRHDVVVTMRTPGEDEWLALGYLLAEGIIEHRSQVASITCSPYRALSPAPGEAPAAAEPHLSQQRGWPAAQPAMVEVTLEPSTQISANCLRRRQLASSSCGICGKTALEDLVRRSSFPRRQLPQRKPSEELLREIDRLTRPNQPLFARCGAVHSCGLFTEDGELIGMFEDVGRHNAFDKLVGYLCAEDNLPPSEERIVWLSGRVSYELMQKAIMAGIGTIVAVGAPSQLAVHLAEQAHIRLIGFADGRRFNLYRELSEPPAR